MSDSCSCCSDILKESDRIFSTACGHIFHQDCLFKPTFVLSNETKNNCPICFDPCTAYDTECLYIHSSMSSKKESAIDNIGLRITKKKMQIQRTINRNKNTDKLGKLIALMEQTKETEKKIDQIMKRNLKKVQGVRRGSTNGAEIKESPSVVAKIKFRSDLRIHEINDEIEILDVKICNMPYKLTYPDVKMDLDSVL